MAYYTIHQKQKHSNSKLIHAIQNWNRVKIHIQMIEHMYLQVE